MDDEELIRRAEVLHVELVTTKTMVEFDYSKGEILSHLAIAQTEINSIIDGVNQRSRTQPAS